jgi:hypothetical protein
VEGGIGNQLVHSDHVYSGLTELLRIRHKVSNFEVLQHTYDFLEPFLNKDWES